MSASSTPAFAIERPTAQGVEFSWRGRIVVRIAATSGGWQVENRKGRCSRVYPTRAGAEEIGRRILRMLAA